MTNISAVHIACRIYHLLTRTSTQCTYDVARSQYHFFTNEPCYHFTGDVGALAEVREELLHNVLEPIAHPERFRALGLEVPAGVLFFGPPGSVIIFNFIFQPIFFFIFIFLCSFLLSLLCSFS